ncbi:MAG: hypothetical protein IT372_29855 [Polyangiaceae bacterium]|nr:hypothetical protein [Polyangiaceae bacterium]
MAAFAIASLLGHALLLGSAAPGGLGTRPAPPPLAARGAGAALAAADAIARADRIERARRALVESARADLAAGRLQLGRFLLRANHIDAEELGEPFDGGAAEARYEERLRALREALRADDLRAAVPAVFGDLRYHGQPGGLMASALLEGGGSCEQVAQLVAAAAFDAGQARAIALRFYGGVMSDGATHVTPIAALAGDEYDLMSGRPAIRKGVRLPAAELVEVYARAHGLAPRVARAEPADGSSAGGGADSNGGNGAGASAALSGPALPTLSAGFPPNDDRYPGALPLYAARAVQDPADSPDEPAEPADDAQLARDCAYFLRMAVLDPPAIEIEPPAGGGAFSIEPARVPAPARLEREAALLRAADGLTRSGDAADRLMAWACLAALGDAAAVDLTLAGERRLAAAAVEVHRRARDEGKRALASMAWSTDAGAGVARRLSEEYGGRTWLLLALEGGEAALEELVQRAPRDDWGRVSALTALVLRPASRPRALAVVERLPPRDQIDVMHELFHAHDHMRPWGSNVDLRDAPAPPEAGAAFLRVYRVFRGLAWRLWEGQRDLPEILDALHRESAAAAIDPLWEAALLEYCAHNALALHAQRPTGLEVTRALREAAARNGHPSLDGLRRKLEYILSRSRLDQRILADAERLR